MSRLKISYADLAAPFLCSYSQALNTGQIPLQPVKQVLNCASTSIMPFYCLCVAIGCSFIVSSQLVCQSTSCGVHSHSQVHVTFCPRLQRTFRQGPEASQVDDKIRCSTWAVQMLESVTAFQTVMLYMEHRKRTPSHYYCVMLYKVTGGNLYCAGPVRLLS